MKTYSTAQVLKAARIGRMTLLRWLKAGKIREPRRVTEGGLNARVWTDRDVERIRKYKQEHYRKGRGRKPKARKTKRK